MMLMGSATSRRALLRQLWAMVQTRTEAASLVVSLQKTAVMQGVALFAVAALAASAFVTALIVFIAVAAPPEWRALALGLVVLALLGTAIFAAMASQLADPPRYRADRGFLEGPASRPRDGEPGAEGSRSRRRRGNRRTRKAKEAVREAAAEKAGTPSTAEDGAITPTGPSVAAASAAMTAASTVTGQPPAKHTLASRGDAEEALRDEAVARTAMQDGDGTVEAFAGVDAIPEAATEREMPAPPVTPAGSNGTPRAIREHRTHGSA